MPPDMRHSSGLVEVPNLVGMTLRAAASACRALRLVLSPPSADAMSGSAYSGPLTVTEQSPAAGDLAAPWAIVKVELRPSEGLLSATEVRIPPTLPDRKRKPDRLS
ncbi:MAG: hypothetical protein JWM49_1520 [Microbacteriaceae bacterium]|nr:hypothetical protein [Microbacteriaceae bacterium]